MATATVSFKLFNSLTGVGADMMKDSQVLQGTATLLAASTYATNGLPLTWLGSITGSSGGRVFPQSNQTVPYDADFRSIGGSGYDYQWDAALDTLRIFLGGTELTNGEAIPGAVYSDVIRFRSYWLKA